MKNTDIKCKCGIYLTERDDGSLFCEDCKRKHGKMKAKMLVVHCGEGFQGRNILTEILELKDIPVEDFIEFDEFEKAVKKVYETNIFDGQSLISKL